MNNKTIIEFGFRIMWRIMEIEDSSQDTQPHSLIVKLLSYGGFNALFILYRNRVFIVEYSMLA